MKTRKRLLSILVATVMAISVIPSATVNAATTENQLDMLVYKADLCVQDGNICQYEADFFLKGDIRTPSEELIASDIDGKLAKGIAAWKAVHLLKNPSGITDTLMDEKTYYESAILSVFISQTLDDNNLRNDMDTATSTASNVKEGVLAAVKTKNFAGLDYRSLDDDTKGNLVELINKNFELNYPEIVKLSDWADTEIQILNAAKDLGEAIDRMTLYCQLLQMQSGAKAVLNAMYSECPAANTELKNALYEVSQAIDHPINMTILNTEEKEIYDVFGTVMDEAWKSVIKRIPGVNAFAMGADIGFFVGDQVADNLLATDKVESSYVRMMAFNDFYTIMKNVTREMRDIYKQSRTDENAANYLASIKALYESSFLSCDYAKKFINAVYRDAGYSKLKRYFTSDMSKDYLSARRSVNNIQKTYKDNYAKINTFFIEDILRNYPDVYLSYVSAAGETEKYYKKQYGSYLYENPAFRTDSSKWSGSFVYLDSDSIPELVLGDNNYKNSEKIYTIQNGKVVCINGKKDFYAGMQYIPAEGRFYTKYSKKNTSYETWYEFNEGSVKRTDYGTLSKGKYRWNSKKVSRKKYQIKVEDTFESELYSPVKFTSFSQLGLREYMKEDEKPDQTDGFKVINLGSYDEPVTIGKITFAYYSDDGGTVCSVNGSDFKRLSVDYDVDPCIMTDGNTLYYVINESDYDNDNYKASIYEVSADNLDHPMRLLTQKGTRYRLYLCGYFSGKIYYYYGFDDDRYGTSSRLCSLDPGTGSTKYLHDELGSGFMAMTQINDVIKFDFEDGDYFSPELTVFDLKTNKLKTISGKVKYCTNINGKLYYAEFTKGHDGKKDDNTMLYSSDYYCNVYRCNPDGTGKKLLARNKRIRGYIEDITSTYVSYTDKKNKIHKIKIG